MTEAEAELPAPPKLDPGRRLILAISQVWAWVFLLGLIIFFTISVNITSDGAIDFLSIANLETTLLTIVPVVLLGLGQTFVIISGGIDLSVGWVMGLASVVCATVVVELWVRGVEPWIAIAAGFVVAIAASAVFGVLNGTIIARLGVPSFIVTLGISYVARGAALIVSGGNSVSGLPPEMRELGNEALLYITPGNIDVITKPTLTSAALRDMDRLLQWPVIIAGVVVLLAAFALARTQFGRHTYAIGGNKMAALRAGVPVDRMTILIFTLSAVTAGLAGCLHSARFAAGSPVSGEPLLLNSIAAVIIGGVSMFGGSGNIIGTLIGSLIISILVTGLIFLSVDPFWQFIVIGIVVILAVLIDQARDLVAGRAEAD
jgi:ribose/xylose/arabinose/galactoside ABC-type transport system permease subunit